MHSRLIFLHRLGLRQEGDAERKVTRQSNAELSLRAKRITWTICREKPPVVPLVARTVNRHRWVSRID
jgi:hypothetical protein